MSAGTERDDGVGSTITASSTTLAPSAQSASSAQFTYPPQYNFPPFFTLQPNSTTRASQFASWSALIVSYCAFHRLFVLNPSHALFVNAVLNRKLAPDDALQVLRYMRDSGRAEWVASAGQKKRTDDGSGIDDAWIWWKTPEEWANSVLAWVEETGQRNAVLTFYELLEGDATASRDFHGLPREMLHTSLNGLSKRGRATVFGEGDGLGVKIY